MLPTRGGTLCKERRTYEIELDWRGSVDVHRAPIAAEPCVAEKFRDVPRADVCHAGGAASGQTCSVKVALCGARFFLDGDGAHDFEDTLTLHPLGLETRRLTDMPEEILSLPGAAHKGHRP